MTRVEPFYTVEISTEEESNLLLITINGRTYELAATATLETVEQDVLAASAAAPAFVRLELTDGSSVSTLVDSQAAITLIDVHSPSAAGTDDPRVLWEHQG